MANKVGYIVYHYELTNIDTYMLLFEPNVFYDLGQVHTHCAALEYLSGRPFYYCKENEIGKLDLVLDSFNNVSWSNEPPHSHF